MYEIGSLLPGLPVLCIECACEKSSSINFPPVWKNPEYIPDVIFFPTLQYEQLVLLEKNINQKISSNDPGTDVGYWESLLQQLKAHMARVSM